MKTEIEILQGIRRYITTSASMNNNELDDNMLIFNLGLLDSMGLLFLIDFIKEEYNLEVMDSELVEENFESVKNIASFVYKKLQNEINS
ncbi:MAG: acyl carrier protein [Dysgonamonadaceae bacterium]|jgi:acyl carrier protein|nr:acyl carrier protein [Dysgonamonadaceae bacterium]MDD3309034.1 acyl carrier protein [Dysgonamonadaceae bacterium]MDD3900960.1 acyl carrier protein [Dysgonamonadaceae bacterium]MDD4399381.1 acyl carrier protein [Dysgonamonadaceae bacterium]MEA5082159.1 acyl carrier protein [Dysgonamonadaceae bacterium]